MKLSALVTALVLGASSVAVAAPSAPMVQKNHHQVTPLRWQNPWVRPAPLPRPQPTRWMLLDTGSASRFGYKVVDVDTKLRFTKLKLEVTRGNALIDRVMIRFANGRTQVIDLDKRLHGYGASSFHVIDLDGANGRMIDKIVVLSRSNARASYSISAA